MKLDRTCYIGASDAAAILGVSPWRTPLDVWKEKTGKVVNDFDNERMQSGRALEGVILQMFARRAEVELTLCDTFLHPQYTFIGATPDAVTDDAVIEAKTVSVYAKGWGEEGSGDVPMYYQTQVQMQMLICNKQKAIMPVLRDNLLHVYYIDADETAQKEMLERLVAFWVNHVQTDVPPEPQSVFDVRGIKPSLPSIVATESVMQEYLRLLQIKRDIKELENSEEAVKSRIQLYMQDAEALVDNANNILCTFKMNKGVARFDAQKLKAERADVYDEFVKVSAGNRVFLTKEVSYE